MHDRADLGRRSARAPLQSAIVSDDSSRDPQHDWDVSYSYRETPADVRRNRIGVTSLLFGIAMGASYLLGRPRR